MKDFEQLDLFGELNTNPIKVKKETKKVQNKIEQKPEKKKSEFIYKEYVMDYLSQGVNSVREICDLLINNHNASKQSFTISGKPHIYTDVCLFLEDLITQDICELVEKKNDYSDRLYKLKL